ncbi:nucleotide sugar dehydrogenase [Methylonatrum kenyense]|uniref:nucleotide sugar dehydrogenase n=1 Tax=Methylonatrum kenyense TaxID=455253 RepID=UPI0020BDAA1D|nr:nucleotide sugar dehydrogenase [Methylonatrum kenyense]MCK8516988.1 nucleotide sugar dehydrogenase [Methylonatrum kenyense]
MTQDTFNAPEAPRLGIIGLGYVGLPLAAEFGQVLPTVGFDINPTRINELQRGHDRTLEVTAEEFAAAGQLELTADPSRLADCNVFIVTVPTPIDIHRRPDMRPLLAASHTVGQALGPGDLVIFESTVYPGATEEDCAPVLAAQSGLRVNEGFFLGYSPERVNPGDRAHRIPDIVKVTSGSTPKTARFVDELYGRIIRVGTHPAPSIRVAEAAKVIENTQRDVNIALVNELAKLFEKLDLDTEAVLQAAGTKWNFLPFRPGLVGGHCIGVDPYYLTHKAQAVGHHPEMILAGRRTNDGMGSHIADRTVKAMIRKGFPVVGSRILLMGLSFKENCPDLRNTRVVDIIADLRSYNAQVDVWDPWINADDAWEEYGLEMLRGEPEQGAYDAVILAVPHRQFRELGAEALRRFGNDHAVVFDVKSVFPVGSCDLRL